MRWLGLWIALLPCSAADLQSRLDALMNLPEARQMGITGVAVANLETGQTVYQRNADTLLLPASNMKLLTAALALERLGADYTFRTRILLDKDGNLILAGAGDSSLSSRTYPYAKGNHAETKPGVVEELADQVVRAGVKAVTGNVIGDDRLYVWEPSPPSWTADDRENGYGAAVSALSYNDNIASVQVTAGGLADEAPIVRPALEYLTIQNFVRTVPAGGAAQIAAKRASGTDQWTISGSIPVGSAPVTLELPVSDPARHAAAALYDALTRRGVAIRGRPLARHRNAGEPYVVPEGREVASRVSPPLRQLVETMLKVSQNLHAEMLFREAGRITQGDASNDSGLRALGTFLKERGATEQEWRAEDGSGLARNDLVTPRLILRILKDQYRARGESWFSLLPAGGSDGTLEHRLCCISAGNVVWAKTGTLNRAVGLSGYAKRADGVLGFSILVNNFSAPTGDVEQWVDKMALALLE